MLIGAANGILVAVFKLNALIVTLAVGAITSGATLWYRDIAPRGIARASGDGRMGRRAICWASISRFGSPLALVVVLTVVLRKTPVGRRFCAAGANPRAAWVAGVNVSAYEFAAYAVGRPASTGSPGSCLSAFIRNPTLRVGEPYLLAPIAAAVLGGTAISGGIGSMIAVSGAALFLTQLGQMLKMLGLSFASAIHHRGRRDRVRHGDRGRVLAAIGCAVRRWQGRTRDGQRRRSPPSSERGMSRIAENAASGVTISAASTPP